MKPLVPLLVGLLVLLSGGTALAASDPSTSAVLEFSKLDPSAARGEFAPAGSLVTFSAEEKSGISLLSVVVNGQRIDAEYDRAGRKVTWNGHNASLFHQDREALRALGQELERRFDRLQLPDHEFLLLRLVLYLGEAPVGLPLPTRTIHLVEPRYEEPRAPKPGVPLVPEEPWTETGLNGSSMASAFYPQGAAEAPSIVMADCEEKARAMGASTAAAAAACQVADDDGVVYMACSTAIRAFYHDAASHCFQAQATNSGPASVDCLGRCGPKCGLTTSAVYTYDCGEHDHCGRIHGGSGNPWDPECGDEYWDADDDFFAAVNCR